MDKERLELIKEIKAQKNILSKKIVTMRVCDYRHQANTIFGWYLIKGIYDKDFDDIREDLGVNRNFNVMKYMGIEHLRSILNALTQYNVVVEYKKDIPFERVRLSLIDNAIEVGDNARRTLKNSIEKRTGKRTSVYTDLLKGMKSNIFLEEETNYDLKQKQFEKANYDLKQIQFKKDEEAFRKESISHYTDEGVEDYFLDNPDEFGFGPTRS